MRKFVGFGFALLFLAVAGSDAVFADYMRVDTDSNGTQFWFGADHTIGNLEVGSDIFVVGSDAELDIGPYFNSGGLTVLPMIGFVFNLETGNATSIIPQLYTTFDSGKLHLESWIQVPLADVFDDAATNSIYSREFLLYQVNDTVAIGPQIELTYLLGDNSEVKTLSAGARVNLSYGENNTLGLFLGGVLESNASQEAKDASDGIAGRLTFTRTW